MAINVRSGGTRSKADALIERICAHEPDTVVVSEYRDTPVGALIRSRLAGRNLSHQAYAGGFRGNGVLIASRFALTASYNPAALADDQYPNGILEAIFANSKLHVFGVYLPGQDRERPHLEWLIRTAHLYNELGFPAICIGDFNSGRNATDIEQNLGRKKLADEFSTADLYERLEREWTEAWLHKHPDALEFSWYPFRLERRPSRSGWRLDKAFVSNVLLSKVEAADYDHAFRTSGLSDHSALVVKMNV